MSHTEHDLKETLAEHSEGGGGGTARLEEIIARGRRIRRRRRWAATGTAVAALAVVAVLTPVPLPGGGVTDARIAAEVREPEGEGVRLAGARFENVGKAETISFTPRSDRTSYRVSCAGPVQAFVRFGDQIDHSRCGNEQALGRHAIGRLEGTKEGITAKVEVFTVPDSQVPADITAEKELSSEDFDRVLAQARTGSGLWEIAIHDGGVSTRSCSPDICLYSGTTLATKGERNLAGLPNSHSVRGGYFTETKKRFSVKTVVDGPGQVYVRCEGEDMYAFIWASEGVLAVAQPCGAKPAKWEFQANGGGVLVAVVRRDQVPSEVDFMRDLQTGAAKAKQLLRTLKSEPGNWEVSVQRWDEPESKVKRSVAPDGTITSYFTR
ncbi:hypothetical protein [Streptosporangium lutulentum]|uniref:Uncharacterized protein n=1 Tax=Streptosporangium lutulentum TaxID=1461250 RepID=A0ABT9QK52_9ACTN|nr:hypothetical protein [Streptosporangium lutulentum]MDP9847094.1 hypothetical protein [Streptosporangium lutulentum]